MIKLFKQKLWHYELLFASVDVLIKERDHLINDKTVVLGNSATVQQIYHYMPNQYLYISTNYLLKK